MTHDADPRASTTAAAAAAAAGVAGAGAGATAATAATTGVSEGAAATTGTTGVSEGAAATTTAAASATTGASAAAANTTAASPAPGTPRPAGAPVAAGKTPPALVGFRLHGRRGSGGAPAAARVQQLLDLPDREAKRAAAVGALHELASSARRTVEALPKQVGERLEQVAGIAVELGLAIARELVGAALDKGIVDPTPTVVRCLRDCVHGSSRADLVVRLHPHDLAAVQTALVGYPEIQEEAAAARFVADPGVPRGGVRAETGTGRLLYDPRDVLTRICDEVRREATT